MKWKLVPAEADLAAARAALRWLGDGNPINHDDFKNHLSTIEAARKSVEAI